MLKAAHIAGLDINVKSFIPDVASAVRTTQMFSDPEVVEAFKRTQERGVGADFLRGLAFVDTTIRDDDVPEIRQVKEYMKPESEEKPPVKMGYHGPSGRVLVNINAVTAEFMKEGGLDHEVSHAKIERDYHGEFAQLEERFGFSRWGKIGNQDIGAVVEAFEEVATHVRTFDVRGKDNAYLGQVYEKYDIQQGNVESIKTFVRGSLADDALVQIAEAIASFDYLDFKTADIIRESLSEYAIGDFGKENIEKIFKLVECFQSAHKLEKGSFEKLRTLLGSIT
ncbi:MAG: hypothetical protein ABIE94_02335 [archaeon]